MKNNYVLCLLIGVGFFISCSETYDDSGLRNRISEVETKLDEHEARIQAIEKLLDGYSDLTEKLNSLQSKQDDFSALVEDLSEKYSSLSEQISDSNSLPTDELVDIYDKILALSDRVSVIETTLENYNQVTDLIQDVKDIDTAFSGLDEKLSELSTAYKTDIEKISKQLKNIPSTDDIISINKKLISDSESIDNLTKIINKIDEEIQNSSDYANITYFSSCITFWDEGIPTNSCDLGNEIVNISYYWKPGKQSYGIKNQLTISYLFSVWKSGTFYYFNSDKNNYVTLSYGGSYYNLGSEYSSIPGMPNDPKLKAFINNYIQKNS